MHNRESTPWLYVVHPLLMARDITSTRHSGHTPQIFGPLSQISWRLQPSTASAFSVGWSCLNNILPQTLPQIESSYITIPTALSAKDRHEPFRLKHSLLTDIKWERSQSTLGNHTAIFIPIGNKY